MTKKTKARSIVTGVALAAVIVVATLLIVISAGATPDPTLLFKCLRFNLMDDGSIQAVVTVSAEDIPYLSSAQFNISYNEKYIQPSDATTNTALSPNGETKVTQAFFQQNPGLYVVDGLSKSPFKDSLTTGDKTLNFGMVGSAEKDRILSMSLYMDNDALRPILPKKYSDETGKVKWLTQFEGDDVDNPRVEGSTTKDNRPYIAAAGKAADGQGAVIGTISFRVTPETLTEMVRRFSAGATDPSTPAGEKNYLLGLSGIIQSGGNDTWAATEFQYNTGGERSDITYTSSAPQNMKMEFLFAFPKVLVKAAPAVGEVTINAYEAFTDGAIGDVAAALRKHSPAVRAGYADGSFEDFLLPWGATDVAADYRVYLRNVDGSKGAEVTAYDPKGGNYLIQQYFFYDEADDDGRVVRKKFPLPMEVKLTVTPVSAVGVTGTNLNKTYLNQATSTAEPVPVFFSKLGLPSVATLVVSPVPGTTSLTLPLDVIRWSNYSADMSKVTTGGDSPTNWPVEKGQIVVGFGAGTYPFTYTLTQAEIEGTYPWLSGVATSYALNATRVIEVNTGGFIDPASYAVAAARTANDENAEFTVTKNGAALAAGDVLTLYLPNGQVVAAGDITVDMTTGTITTTADNTDKELRRYLNLGGWFAVGVQENGTANPNPELPVYLPPRDNLYLEDRVGTPDTDTGNLGRFDFSGYYAGVFPYAAAKKLGNTVVLPTGYFVGTTYDGMNGAPNGKLSTVRAGWEVSDPQRDGTNTKLYTYGPQSYATGWFDGYGRVTNTDKRVEIRVEDQAEKTGTLGLRLTCPEGTNGATVSGGQVTGLVYNTRQKGYRARQEFTLTLTNTGTRDIYGLSLNLPPDNHFEIIKAPAAYLAVGTETTFVVTYRYDLKPANESDTGLTFKDTIDITTNETGSTPVKRFTAQFRVTNGPVSAVKVVTNSPSTTATPAEPIMGDAELIVGLAEGVPAGDVPADGVTSGADKPDTTGGPTDYEANYKHVWVRTELYDEYAVGEVYYYKNNVQTPDNKTRLTEYKYTVTDGEGNKVAYYYFQMPDDDVLVHVDFVESIHSKLRLSAILPEAHVDSESMSRRDLRRWDNNAVTANNGTPLTMEESSLDHFLVVLGANDKEAQLTITLRQVAAIIPGYNEHITPNVLMKSGDDTLLNETGDTATPSGHKSTIFTAPEPGSSKDIVITLSYTPPAPAGETAKEISREFTVTFAKPPATVAYTLGYGNSPYGMIMNSSLTDAEKVTAKADFALARAFSPILKPAAAAGLANVYAVDAWGGGTDYDIDETALFVHPGESFLDPGVTAQDSANKPVLGEKISRTVTVTLLDDRATTQAGRFSGANTVTLDLGTAEKTTVEDWWVGTDSAALLIRPGAYEMVYTFTDYDGVTPQRFTRPLIILPRNGDVNADMKVEESDADVIENRVTDPMGYTAAAADYPAWQFLRHRVCDVNNDGNFNNIDANLVRDTAKIVPYYLPINYK